MSDPEFKPGDIVTLRSGGPEMSVAYVYAGDQGTFPSGRHTYDCFWFDDEKHLQRSSFAEETLRVPNEAPFMKYVKTTVLKDQN